MFSRQYIDKTFWVLFFTLIVVAIIALFSAGSTLAYADPHSTLSPILKQILFIVVGIGCAYLVQFVSTPWIRLGGYLCLIVSWLMLLSMLIPGNPFVVYHNGAGRWLNLFGIEFQPSEITKLGLIIVVADLLARIRSKEDAKRYFFITLGITVAVCVPIMTGNMSTAVLMAGIVFLMWFLARLPWHYLAITGASAVALALLFYFVVEFAFVRPHRNLPKPFDRAITQVGRIDDMIAE